MSTGLRLLLGSALLLALAAPGSALTVAIPASDSGNYSSAGAHALGDLEYVAGWDNETFRNYFVFDLSG
ncbi:MAG: hypothetical protein ACRD2A_17960, partial [Vicinamibacterales bacterium]